MFAEDCDLLIIGGGPAGLIAARDAAREARQASIVLLERDIAVGAPVRCGEGVGSAGLSEFLAPSENGVLAPWIDRRITRVVFRSPNGSTVRVAEGDVGFILDRRRFEPVLAEQACAAGADVRTSSEAVCMHHDGTRWCVRVECADGSAMIRARIVIGADGVEGAVGRWAGLDT